MFTREVYTNSKGENFSYLTHGNQAAENLIFFFHATGFNAETYNSFLSNLSKKLGDNYKIISLDQRGHGLSLANADPRKLSTWNSLVDDAKEFVQKFSSKKLYFSGHSMGAIIALKLSTEFSEISRLFLIDPVLPGPKFSAYGRVKKFFRLNKTSHMVLAAKNRRFEFASKQEAFNHFKGRGAYKSWTDDILQDYLNGGMIVEQDKAYLSCHPHWEAEVFNTASLDTWKYIKKVKCKVFVPYALIASTMGDGARKSLQKNHNFRLKPYDASHFLPMEKGDQLSSDIESFILN